jgi:hypothetical protein
LNTVDAVVAADIVADIVVDAAAAAVDVVDDMADADTVVGTADAVVAAACVDRHCHGPVTALSPPPEEEIHSYSPLNWKSSLGYLHLPLP